MEIFKDKGRNPAERAADLLDRMTLEEKIAQLQCCTVMDTEGLSELDALTYGVGELAVQAACETPQKTAALNRRVIEKVMGNNRFHIPPIIHLEALTGAVIPGASVFPSAIGLGATFDPEIVEDMAGTIAKDLRSTGYRQALSPVMDLGRDPRWGRIGETYGEDPTLDAQMSAAFTRGLQGKDRDTGVSATGKHFLGYSFGDGGLNMSSNPIPERDIHEAYAKPFQAAITEAGLCSVMNSYGSLDNELVIGSEHILTDLLRGELGFDGAVVSDYASVEKLVSHRICKDMDEAGAMALEAGLDIECPLPSGYKNLAWAVQSGRISEDIVDRAARHVLELKFRLGLFDDPFPYDEAQVAEIFSSAEPAEKSLRTSREAIVLLKNDGILPLKKQERQKIAVIGPHADNIRLMFGCYTLPAAIDMGISGALAEMAGMDSAAEKMSAGGDAVKRTNQTYEGSSVLREVEAVGQTMELMYGQITPTILHAIKAKIPDADVAYAKGCEYAGFDRSSFKEALEVAGKADVIIAAVGGKYGWGGSCTVGEGIDSSNIGLTGVQEELVLKLCDTKKPVILLHLDARPLSSMALKEQCAAILECWFPGSTGGKAIADVLFGDYNPAGRLSVTAARNAGQIPIYAGQKTGNSYQAVRAGMSLCKYAEGDTEPLFPFGFGQSYTSFEYSDLKVTPETTAAGTIDITFTVRNTGDMNGEEVAQVYVEDVLASMLRPNREFAGCARIALRAGEMKTVTLRLRADQFAFMDKDMKWIVEAGEMKVYVGGSSDDIRLEGGFEITDTAYINPAKRGFYAERII